MGIRINIIVMIIPASLFKEPDFSLPVCAFSIRLLNKAPIKQREFRFTSPILTLLSEVFFFFKKVSIWSLSRFFKYSVNLFSFFITFLFLFLITIFLVVTAMIIVASMVIIIIMIRKIKRPEPEVVPVFTCAFEDKEHNNNPKGKKD